MVFLSGESGAVAPAAIGNDVDSSDSSCQGCSYTEPDLDLGGVSEELLQLVNGYEISSLYFAALFVLPSAIKGTAYTVTCIGGRSTLVRAALALLCFACAACSALFAVANISLIVEVHSPVRSAPTAAGKEYVAFLTHPAVPSVDYTQPSPLPEPHTTFSDRRSLDLSLLYMFGLQEDRRNARNIFQAAFIGGFFEVLIPVGVLVPVVVLLLFRRSFDSFNEYFKGVQRLPTSRPSPEPSAPNSVIDSTSDSDSSSGFGRDLVTCIHPSHIAIDILSKFGHLLVGGVRVAVLGLVLALLAGFLLGPLVYTSLRQPGFGMFESSGLGARVGAPERCPQVENVLGHYEKHVFWPDLQDSGGLQLREGSFSHLVFGTTNYTAAAQVLWNIHCEATPEDHLNLINTEGVVFPVENVLSCECSDASMHAEGVRCPEPTEIFRLLDRSGPAGSEYHTKSNLPGIKSMWILALVGPFVLTAVQLVLVVIEAAIMWGDGFAGSRVVKSYKILNHVTAYLLVVVYILVPCGFLIAWAKGVGMEGSRDVVLGNVCVTKASNLYAPQLSRVLAMLVAANVGSFLVMDVFLNHKLVADH